MYNPFLVSSLKKCETGAAVDAAFDKRRITDLNERIKYLKICLGNPKVYFGMGVKTGQAEELSSEYLTVRSMFVTGSWR